MENYIKTAICYAEGKMSGSDFEIEQASEPELWPWLQSLLTEEMKTDPKHEFWNICHSRSALEANNFRVKATALAFGYGFFGNMHDIVSSLVKTVYPDIKIKTPPSYTQYDFMYEIGVDYIGGKEADIIVQDILDKLPSDLKKSERKREAKNELRKAFPITKRKPLWVQEPEWPVSNGKPLKFISQTKDGEKVCYEFYDEANDCKTIIEQLL